MKLFDFKNRQLTLYILITSFGIILMFSFFIFFNISDIRNPLWIQSIGSFLLLLVTALYVVSTHYLVQFQINQSKIEKLNREMDLIIGPLFVNIKKNLFFGQYARFQFVNDKRNTENYDTFWNEIIKHLYLCPQDLRSVIRDYIDLNNAEEKPIEKEYDNCEKNLFLAIEMRYKDIITELSALYQKM